MIDCLIIGYNDSSFEEYVGMVRAMGTDSGAFRDLNLAYIQYNGKPYRSMDFLNLFASTPGTPSHPPFSNVDFMWPVVLYLGSYLARRGFSFDYVNLFQAEKDKLREKLARKDIRTIAITTTLYVSVEPILEIVSFIRKYNQTAKIIIGGPYIHNQAKMLEGEALLSVLDYIGADFYVISQEGELALAGILGALRNGSDLSSVDNIAYREGGRLIQTNCSPEASPLEENMEDYSLFPREAFGEFVTLRTAKSCPFACSFCGFPQRAGKYTYLPVPLVEKHLDSIREIGGVTTLTFIDDTFNVPKARFKELLRMMIRQNYGFKWNSYLRSDHADQEAIDLMRQSGCEGVFLGIESGSDRMLLRMNKTSRRADYLRVIPLLRDAGIGTHANLIIGFPGETFETVRETVDLIEEAKPDYFRAQLWYCDPTTPIWQQREELKIKGSAFTWAHMTMDADTASDLVDQLFLGVENSTWLPQYGFEMWSLFYLQRKGMTQEKIRTFVRSFNAAVKEKLIHPDRPEVSAPLLESLMASCRFRDGVRPDSASIQALSGAGYTEAVRFWSKEVLPDRPALNRPAADGKSRAPRRRHELGRLAPPLQASFLAASGGELSNGLLAAYAVLFSTLRGTDGTLILAGFPGETGLTALPVRLPAPWGKTFTELASQTRQAVRRSAEQERYALYILTNATQMAERGGSLPTFDLGFVVSSAGREEPLGSMEKALAAHPALFTDLDLILEVAEDPTGPTLAISYDPAVHPAEAVEGMARELVALLETVSANPDLPLGATGDLRGRQKIDRPLSLVADEKEEFDFGGAS